jgi:hypothetical protein
MLSNRRRQVRGQHHGHRHGAQLRRNRLPANLCLLDFCHDLIVIRKTGRVKCEIEKIGEMGRFGHAFKSKAIFLDKS